MATSQSSSSTKNANPDQPRDSQGHFTADSKGKSGSSAKSSGGSQKNGGKSQSGGNTNRQSTGRNS